MLTAHSQEEFYEAMNTSGAKAVSDEPTCPSCKVAYENHLGVAGLCAELTELRKGREDAEHWKTKANNLKHDRDRFIDWLKDPERKSPAAEFTSGPWRVMADLVISLSR